QLGQGAFRILVRVKTRLGTLDIALGGIVLDRALGLVLLVSYPKKHVGAATALLALRKLAPHFQYGFTVRNLTPPTIGGAPQARRARLRFSGAVATRRARTARRSPAPLARRTCSARRRSVRGSTSLSRRRTRSRHSRSPLPLRAR